MIKAKTIAFQQKLKIQVIVTYNNTQKKYKMQNLKTQVIATYNSIQKNTRHHTALRISGTLDCLIASVA